MTGAPPLDGVQLAIRNKRLEGVCRTMANTLFRTGRSGVLNTARDFSCCIVTADNQLLATAESLPIHVLSGPDLMAAAMQEFHPVLKRGDAFLHNSPYHGCSHPADHTILVPVLDDHGRHRFTVVAKAHQADCGNSLATTYMGGARDVYQEGALIFPAVRVQENYQDVEDIVRFISTKKGEPEGLLDWRLRAYRRWQENSDDTPTWAHLDYPEIDYQAHYFPGFDLSEQPGDVTAPAPVIGQDNELVFREFLGLSQEEYQELEENGVF